MGYTVVGCAILLAGVFTVSASSKVRRGSSFAAFVTSVRELARVGREAARPLALVVMTAEFAVPVAMLWWPALGFAVAIGLLAAFTVAIAAALRRPERTPCRCFGVSSAPVSRWHLLRNALLGAAAITGLALLAAGDGLGPGWVAGELQAAGVFVAGVAALMFGALIVFYDDIVELLVGG